MLPSLLKPQDTSLASLLHSIALAQVQISQHKYAEADRTYDRAAIIQDMMIGNADSTLGKDRSH